MAGMKPEVVARFALPTLACRPDDSTTTERSPPPRTDRRAHGAGHQPVVELEPRRPRAVPLDRPGALAPHAAQSHRAAAPGGSRPARRLRAGPCLSAALRRGYRVEWLGGRDPRHLVRNVVPQPGPTENRLLLRRVRPAQLGADLLGGPRSARRRPLQDGVGPGRSARR